MPKDVNVITLSLNCANHEIRDIAAAVQYIQEHYVLGRPNVIIIATQEDRTGLLDSLGFSRSFGKRLYKALTEVPASGTSRNKAISDEIKNAYKHTERTTTLTKPTEPGSIGIVTLVTNALVTPLESIHEIKRNKGVVAQRFVLENPAGDLEPLTISAGTLHLDSNSDAARTRQMQKIDSRMRHDSSDDVRPVRNFAQLASIARRVLLLGGDVNTRTKQDGTRPLDAELHKSRIFPAYLLGYRIGESKMDTYSKPTSEVTPGKRVGEKPEGQLDTIMHATGLNLAVSEFKVFSNTELTPPNLFGGERDRGTDHALVARTFNVSTDTYFPERNITRTALHAVLKDDCSTETIDKLDIFLSHLKPTSATDQKILLDLYNTAILLQQIQIKLLHSIQSGKSGDTVHALEEINSQVVYKLLDFINNPDKPADFTVQLSFEQQRVLTNYNDGPNLTSMIIDFNKQLRYFRTIEPTHTSRIHAPLYEQFKPHKSLPSAEPSRDSATPSKRG